MVTAFAVIATSAFVIDQKGMPDRSSPEIQKLLTGIAEGKKQRRIGIRQQSCHFKRETSQALSEDYSPCLPENHGNAVVILGDSHAADIWMGLSRAFPNLSIVQFTGAGCSLARSHVPNGHCAAMLDVANHWISKNTDKIEAVIHSQRAGHIMNGDPEKDVSVMLTDFSKVERLKAQLDGISSIGLPVYFWGPRPEFHPVMQVVVTRNRTMQAIKEHYHNADFSVFRSLDNDLKLYFSDHSVTYVSSIELVCTPTCPFMLPDGKPVFVDYAHWSPNGAALAVDQVVQGSEVLSTLLQAPTH
ncbi:MAG: SGNH hydrolase domain-containing protein [Ruegeria sp.]